MSRDISCCQLTSIITNGFLSDFSRIFYFNVCRRVRYLFVFEKRLDSPQDVENYIKNLEISELRFGREYYPEKEMR